MRTGLPTLGAALATACTVLAAMAGPAAAEPVNMPGSPLSIYVGPEGEVQAIRTFSGDSIFYPPFGHLGDAGFFLALIPSSGDGSVWGFDGQAPGAGVPNTYTNVSPGTLSGSGSGANPYTLVTEYKTAGGTDGVHVTQTTTYVNGAQQFGLKWAVTNKTGAPVNFRAFAAADFFFEGDDRGTGIFTLGPPRFIGGNNVDSGNSGGFVEVSPAWSHYQELPYPDVWTVLNGTASATSPTSYDDTVDPNDVDNAGAVEWDDHATSSPLQPDATATYQLIVRSSVPSELQLSPTNAGAPQGVPINITATATDTSGQPYVGKTLRYSIAGPNASTAATTLGPAGTGVITDPGTNAGGDTVTVFVDFNNDGVREAVEPQASALATFVDHIAPNCSVKVKGDRPGGGGGAGNALVITVNCGETTQLSVDSTLVLPAAHHSSAGGAKKNHKKKVRKIKLPRTTATILPGKSVPVAIKVPKRIARKYAGRKLTAKFVIKVKDGVGNVQTIKKTKKIKIAKPKKRGKHKSH